MTDFKSYFKASGINQTNHRIYLEVSCKVSVITPYETKEIEIKNQILMADSIIVGKIPQSYYNIEGTNIEDSIPLMED